MVDNEYLALLNLYTLWHCMTVSAQLPYIQLVHQNEKIGVIFIFVISDSSVLSTMQYVVELTKTLLNRRSNSLGSGGGILTCDCIADALTRLSILDAMSPICGRGRCLIWTLSSASSIITKPSNLPIKTFRAARRVVITCDNQMEYIVLYQMANKGCVM